MKKDPHLAEVIELLESDFFNPEEPGLYQPLVDALMKEDYFLVLADFEAYRLAHQDVDRAWSDRERWNRMALANVSGVGFFSSDRTIREYARDIWKIAPLVAGSGPR